MNVEAAATRMPGLGDQVRSVSIYAAICAGCLGIFATGVTRRGLLILAVTYVVRFLGISIGYHRYFSHRSFQTTRVMQFVLGLWATLGLQRGVLWWAQTHREHHRHADTEKDLHSPTRQGFWYAHCGWFFEAANLKTNLGLIRDFASYPELRWLDSDSAIALIAVSYAGLMFWLFRWEGLVWGVCWSTVLCWQMVHCIQSLSHAGGGYRRFASNDSSRNHWLLGVVTFGEFHNNHHAFPWSARQSFAWWEPDPGFWLLKVWEALGLGWNVKTASIDGHEHRITEWTA
jgi:stearoyl-CoA desaturase (delta-9 desaturase)